MNRALLAAIVGVFLLPMAAALAQTDAQDKPKEPPAAAAQAAAQESAKEQPAPESAKTSDEEKEWENRWFWFVCSTNYHNRLTTSERQIDKQINGLFGTIFPNWEGVTTFQDWRDNWFMWDLSAGVGRDINPHLAWTVYGVAGTGTIRNRDDYHLLLVPVGMKVNFIRTSLSLGASLRWWPWERAHRDGKGLWSIIKGVRPVTEMNVGYSREISTADVRASVPVVGDLLHIKQTQTYNLGWLSPRAGIEIPLSDKYSINVLGGYLWFNNAQNDFDGWMLEFMFCGRF